MTHVVAICGSLRDESRCRLALDHALRGVEEAGGTGEVLDLRTYDLPLFDGGAQEAGDAPELTRRVRGADAIVLGTPVYHGSYSSVLKTALDYCGFDEFESKTVGLLAVAGGQFPVTALEHLRSVCRALDAWVLPHETAIPRAGSAFEDGEFVDEKLEHRTVTLGRRVVEYATVGQNPETFESDQNVGG
ncbi:MAG: NADPH-dependent FMN reductase [Haloferacaceae archaeon]